MKKWLPVILMFVMALWFFGNLQTPPDKYFAFNEFARLPLTANGRIVPLDSLARNSLLEIREKQTLNTEPWKGWNEKWWDSLGRGEKAAPWATKFCSPIEALQPGAIVLARLAAGIDAAPALVTMPGDARVLWAGGFFDLETEAYKSPRSVLAFRVLLHNWMLWLAPRNETPSWLESVIPNLPIKITTINGT